MKAIGSSILLPYLTSRATSPRPGRKWRRTLGSLLLCLVWGGGVFGQNDALYSRVQAHLERGDFSAALRESERYNENQPLPRYGGDTLSRLYDLLVAAYVRTEQTHHSPPYLRKLLRRNPYVAEQSYLSAETRALSTDYRVSALTGAVAIGFNTTLVGTGDREPSDSLVSLDDRFGLIRNTHVDAQLLYRPRLSGPWAFGVQYHYGSRIYRAESTYEITTASPATTVTLGYWERLLFDHFSALVQYDFSGRFGPRDKPITAYVALAGGSARLQQSRVEHLDLRFANDSIQRVDPPFGVILFPCEIEGEPRPDLDIRRRWNPTASVRFGGRMRMTPHLSLFAEMRYQVLFGIAQGVGSRSCNANGLSEQYYFLNQQRSLHTFLLSAGIAYSLYLPKESDR